MSSGGAFDERRRLLCLARRFRPAIRRGGKAALAGRGLHPAEQHLPLAMGADGGGKRVFECLGLADGQGFAAIGMAGLAAETQDLAFLDLVQHAAALRAAEQARLADGAAWVDHGEGFPFGDLRLRHHSGWRRPGRPGRAAREAGQQRWDVVQRQAMIRAVALQGVARHVGPGRVLGVLHHVHAAAGLQRHQPRSAVIEQPRQHHADRPVARRDRGGAEQRVHRGAGAVLLRAAAYQHVPPILGHQQVTVWWRHVDAAVLDPLAVKGMPRRQPPRAVQDRRHHGSRGGRDVLNHQHCRRKILRQTSADAGQGLHTPCRGADQDQVTGHVVSWRRRNSNASTLDTLPKWRSCRATEK